MPMPMRPHATYRTAAATSGLHPQSRSADWHTQHKHLPNSPHQVIELLDRKSEPKTAHSLRTINLDFAVDRKINSAGGRRDILRCHPKSKILNEY